MPTRVPLPGKDDGALYGCVEDAGDPQALAADLLRGRRSIRRYLPVPVPRAVIDRLLEAAVTAPSAHNRQPWRFVVIEQHATREALADAMGARLREDRRRDGDRGEVIEQDVIRSRARLASAPVLIVVCMSMTDMDRYPDARRNAAERTMAVQSVAMASHGLLLAAHAEGLGACWMCAPLFCPDAVAAVLALPEDWEPQAIVTLGYAADTGKVRPRRPLSQVVRYQDLAP